MKNAYAFPPALCDRLINAGAIAVLVIDNVDHAVRVAEALWKGGVEIVRYKGKGTRARMCNSRSLLLADQHG